MGRLGALGANVAWRGWWAAAPVGQGGAVLDDATVPPEVARWVDERHAPWRVVADASWERPSSRVWRLEVRGAEAFLKISASREAFERERTALADRLPSAAVSTQRLIDADAGLGALLTAAVPGQVVRGLDAPAATEQDVHAQAGTALRVVHGLLDEPHTAGARADRAAALRATARADLATCRARLTTDDLAAVSRADDVVGDAAQHCDLGYVHGDFQPRNWLWDPGSGTVSLIDFEEATVGFTVEDLGWLFATTWPRRRDLADAFLRGYGRTLTAPEQALLTAGTVLGSLRHVADGERLGVAKKVDDGLRGLRVAASMLARGRA